MLSAKQSTISPSSKHSLQSKWNILFDKPAEWIAFKPQVGLKVYPCYSCRHMFSSKLTFQDHINRRVIIIKYKCNDCSNTLTFYNRCSFLLHTRKHYLSRGGQVNLGNVDISILPVELAGFFQHENIPFLYDEEEEFVPDDVSVNTQFYSADEGECGKQIVTLKPFNLMFHFSEGDKSILLTLKQITSNVPLCKFVAQTPSNQHNKPTTKNKNLVVSDKNSNVQHNKKTKRVDKAIEDKPEDDVIPLNAKIKEEVDDFRIPVISKIESLNELATKNCEECPECSLPLFNMNAHFLATNKPLDETLVCYICKYLSPTACSLKAHMRTHSCAAPFICPECGSAFKDSDTLYNHMEDVCFHFNKQLRFRCPAIKCGKLFVLFHSFLAHFANHVKTIKQCNVCSATFYKDSDFQEHSAAHESCKAIKCYNCTVCKSGPIIDEEDYKNHVNFHVNDRERCVYIYLCKYCRNSFRSTSTYAVHKTRCVKNYTTPISASSSCHFCGQKIVFKEKIGYKVCPNCKQINYCPNNFKLQGEKKWICILCKLQVAEDDKKGHAVTCKYNNPVVPMYDVLSSEVSGSSCDLDENSSERFSDADISSKFNDSVTSETRNKKRKRLNQGGPAASKTKKSSDSGSVDLQADEPMPFDGTYYCKSCSFHNSDRELFHKHIVEHRDVSTSYQCMECGDCFMVKPSLIKHLTHFHKINDIDDYLKENDCCDKSAIEDLEINLNNIVPGEYKGPLNENQCSVCLTQCESGAELNKHFRVHGMAFIKKNTNK